MFCCYAIFEMIWEFFQIVQDCCRLRFQMDILWFVYDTTKDRYEISQTINLQLRAMFVLRLS